ncbi:hypothetical protein CAOG_04978 [Capsaspora owczarzaki ATCC 30864]|nr:hypothetical protein CAOG_04978 [Capsaspora owczarzaki ATCC 30864]|eukprot:XP_004346663.1 hypothetical protein CAOG_04978 [Capsaspora owczarzaki ATCC 30864]
MARLRSTAAIPEGISNVVAEVLDACSEIAGELFRQQLTAAPFFPKRPRANPAVWRLLLNRQDQRAAFLLECSPISIERVERNASSVLDSALEAMPGSSKGKSSEPTATSSASTWNLFDAATSSEASETTDLYTFAPSALLDYFAVRFIVAAPDTDEFVSRFRTYPSFTDDLNMVSLFADRVRNDASVEAQFKQIVERARKSAAIGLTSDASVADHSVANAMSVLTAAGCSFNRAALQNLQAPDANLTHAMLVEADVSGSDLSAATLAGAQTRDLGSKGALVPAGPVEHLPLVSNLSGEALAAAFSQDGLLLTVIDSSLRASRWDVRSVMRSELATRDVSKTVASPLSAPLSSSSLSSLSSSGALSSLTAASASAKLVDEWQFSDPPAWWKSLFGDAATEPADSSAGQSLVAQPVLSATGSVAAVAGLEQTEAGAVDGELAGAPNFAIVLHDIRRSSFFRRVLVGHQHKVTSMMFVGDAHLVSGDASGQIRIWHNALLSSDASVVFGPGSAQESEAATSRAITATSFIAQREYELTIHEGDEVQVLDQSNPDWWWISFGGRQGCVPQSCLMPLAQEAARSLSGSRTSLLESVPSSEAFIVARRKALGTKPVLHANMIGAQGELVVAATTKAVQLWSVEERVLAREHVVAHAHIVAATSNQKWIACTTDRHLVLVFAITSHLSTSSSSSSSKQLPHAYRGAQLEQSYTFDLSRGQFDQLGAGMLASAALGLPSSRGISLKLATQSSVLACSGATQVTLFDLDAGHTVAHRQIEGGHVVGFSDDCSSVAVAFSKRVLLWDVELPSDRELSRTQCGGLSCLSVCASANLLVTGETFGSIKVWDASSLALLATLGQSFPVHSVAMSPLGNLVAAAGLTIEQNTSALQPGQVLKMWQTLPTKTQEAKLIQGCERLVRSVSFGRDGKFMACGEAEGRVTVWSTETGRVKYDFGKIARTAAPIPGADLALDDRGHEGPVLSVCFSQNTALVDNDDGGRFVLVSSSESPSATVVFWDLISGQSILQLAGIGGRVAELSSCSQYLAATVASSGYRTVAVHVVPSLLSMRQLQLSAALLAQKKPPTPLLTFRGHDGPVTCISFAPNGMVAATGSADTTVRIWAMPPPHTRNISNARANGSGRCLAVLRAHTDIVTSVAFHGESGMLYSCGLDGALLQSAPVAPCSASSASSASSAGLATLSSTPIEAASATAPVPHGQPPSAAVWRVVRVAASPSPPLVQTEGLLARATACSIQ